MLCGLICPDNTVTRGEKTTWETCLSRDCHNCLPRVIRKAIHAGISERDRWVSPSTLVGCLRKAKWEKMHDFYLPPIQAYWFMRGNMMHEVLEKSASEGGLTEHRVSRKVDGTNTVLEGQIDRYKDGVLDDYKTMADMGFNLFKKEPRPKEPHVIQANIYRWMLLPDYPVDKIRIIYIGMGVFAVSGEHIVIDKWGKITEYNLDPCPMWSEQKVLDYIQPKIKAIETLESPPANPSEKWLCDICPFQDKCHST